MSNSHNMKWQRREIQNKKNVYDKNGGALPELVDWKAEMKESNFGVQNVSG